MPRAANVIEFHESLAVVAAVRGQMPHSPRDLFDHVSKAAAGMVNGKPFLAVCTANRGLLNMWWHSVFGGISEREEAAVKARMRDIECAVVHDLRGEGVGRIEFRTPIQDFIEARTVWLDAARGANAVVKRHGGVWHDAAKCWSVVAGTDLGPLDEAGIRERPAPDVHELAVPSRDLNAQVKALGGWWDGSGWMIDLAVADRGAVEGIGVTVGRSQARIWYEMSLERLARDRDTYGDDVARYEPPPFGDEAPEEEARFRL